MHNIYGRLYKNYALLDSEWKIIGILINFLAVSALEVLYLKVLMSCKGLSKGIRTHVC